MNNKCPFCKEEGSVIINSNHKSTEFDSECTNCWEGWDSNEVKDD